MSKKLRILVVMRETSDTLYTHGHPEAATAPILCRLLSEMPSVAEVQLCSNVARLRRTELSAFSAVVFNSKNEQQDPLAVAALNEFVRDQARGLVLIHNASASFANYEDTNPDWLDLIGSGYVYARPGQPAISSVDGPARKLLVDLEWANHPILEAIPNTFELPQEELFRDMRVSGAWHGAGRVLAFGRHPVLPEMPGQPASASRPIAYVLEHRYGRVLNMYLGHFISTYLHSHFRRIISQGVEWVANYR